MASRHFSWFYDSEPIGNELAGKLSELSREAGLRSLNTGASTWAEQLILAGRAEGKK